MEFTFAGQPLTDADSPASGIRIAGLRVVDEVDAVLRASKAFFGRGNRATPIAFTTRYEFATLKEAEVWALLLNSLMAEVGTLVILCGQTGDTQEVTFGGAALSGLTEITQRGVEISVTYDFRCGLGSTSLLPDFPIPSNSDPMILRNETTITSGATFVDVTWTTQPAAPTTVNVNLVVPDSAGEIINIVEQRDLRTASGTRFRLATATPAANYKASWTAIF